MRILAGDIGGTNARLALVRVDDGRLVHGDEVRLPSRDFASLEALLRSFLDLHAGPVAAAGLGLPGPVRDGRVAPTNLPWSVDARQLRQALKLEQLWLLNDLEALAHGLDGAAVETLQSGQATAGGNRAVIAAGTGLGQAVLYWDGTCFHPYATEGGHADFAPRNELQFELLRFLQQRYDRVSWERLVSGPGLVNIFEFLCSRPGAQPAVSPLAQADPPAAVTEAALAKSCPVARHSLALFVELYGAEAGNLALKAMATGGLFVAGGIAPRILAPLREPPFVEAFVSKGRMRGLLESMPLHVVLDDATGLRGAALFAARQGGVVPAGGPPRE